MGGVNSEGGWRVKDDSLSFLSTQSLSGWPCYFLRGERLDEKSRHPRLHINNWVCKEDEKRTGLKK
jgi:hypothetical protein